MNCGVLFDCLSGLEKRFVVKIKINDSEERVVKAVCIQPSGEKDSDGGDMCEIVLL